MRNISEEVLILQLKQEFSNLYESQLAKQAELLLIKEQDEFTREITKFLDTNSIGALIAQDIFLGD